MQAIRVAFCVLLALAATAAEPVHLTVAPVKPENPRNSEAAIIPLSEEAVAGLDGILCGQRRDHRPARLVGKISKDRGRTGAISILVENDGGNVMEVNFLRLKDNAIALFCQKNSEDADCRVMMRTSRMKGPPSARRNKSAGG